MKIDKSIIGSFVLLVIMASLYRVMPERPLGFAPQIAMALFSGSIMKEKRFAFLLPLFSMLLSDLLYEVLFWNHLSAIPGFYKGQLLNYVLFTALTAIGFFVTKNNILQIIAGSLVAPTLFFIASNFLDWAGGGLDIASVPYAKTWDGLLRCYEAGLPFYKGSLYATCFFSGVLFTGYFLLNRYWSSKAAVAA